MKKLLFAAYSLDVGGIETALLTLLNYLASNKKYDITLVLEKKQGIFLESLDKRVKIITYTPSINRIYPIRKCINLFKRICFTLKYKNRFDFAGDYATYSMSSSFVTRVASKNNAVWIHNDYLHLLEEDLKKYKEFFESIHARNFRHIIFVSLYDKKIYDNQFPECVSKTLVCHNLIDYKDIEEKAKQKIDLEKSDVTTFINVGRHAERQKKITRIIEASKKLKDEKEKFRVLLVGIGEQTNYYKELVKKYNLENEIIFLGRQKNPYPYFKISNCMIMSSDFEGYPVVFVESFILGLPIITTDVSDSRQDIKDKRGIITNKTTKAVYEAMKKFIHNGYEIKEKFDAEKYNEEIIEKLEKMF